MGLFDKRALLKFADRVGFLAGTTSKLVVEKSTEAARATSEVVRQLEQSYKRSAGKVSGYKASQEATPQPWVNEAAPTTTSGTRAEDEAKPQRTQAFCSRNACSDDALPGKIFCAEHQKHEDDFVDRHCGRKMVFLTFEEAQDHATDLSLKTSRNYVAYVCKVCNRFHFGTSKLN